LYAVVPYASLNNAVRAGYVLTLGILFLAIPMAAAAFSVTRAYLPPSDTPSLHGPHDTGLLVAGPAQLPACE
jgi:hypothetical protein